MIRTKTDHVEIMHRLSSKHRGALLESEVSGCFFCLRTFPSETIEEWTDDNQTALCPNCGIDSVLPGAWIDLDGRLLEWMNERWFCKVVDPKTAAEIDASVEQGLNEK